METREMAAGSSAYEGALAGRVAAWLADCEKNLDYVFNYEAGPEDLAAVEREPLGLDQARDNIKHIVVVLSSSSVI
jgi:hypothetical protein